MPSFASGHATTTTGPLRYEDITQDGRILPIAIPPALGALWREVLLPHPRTRAATKAGIIPILTRLTLASIDQPIRVDRPIETVAGYELARDDHDGEVKRLHMNVWAEIRGTAGRMSRRDGVGETALAGTLFAEHTFTRLLAPPDQRKVTRFDIEGYPAIPEARHAAAAATTAEDAPPGARWIDELASDPVDACFTLDQTDSNQHVNSLTYVRVFLDAVYRRLAVGGHPMKVRSRAIDVAYRKPSFVGDRVRAQLRLFEHDGSLGAAGQIAGGDGKTRCYVRVLLGA